MGLVLLLYTLCVAALDLTSCRIRKRTSLVKKEFTSLPSRRKPRRRLLLRWVDLIIRGVSFTDQLWIGGGRKPSR